MMPKNEKPKNWSKKLEAHGVRFRIYETATHASIWFSIMVDGPIDRDGKKTRVKKRQSFHTSDRSLAEDHARDIAREIAEARLTGVDLRRPTLGQVFRLYRQVKLPLLSPARAKLAETHLDLFTAAWGTNFEVGNLSPSHVAQFVADRRSGALAPTLKGRRATGVRDGTIDGDFRWLRSVFNFARRHKVDGGRRRFLTTDPLDDLQPWPKETKSPWPKE